MKRWLHNRKKFLNKNGYHSQAYIITAIEDNSTKKCKSEWSVSPTIDFTMADCDNKINLIFSVTDSEWVNTQFKINLLQKEIALFADKLPKARETYLKKKQEFLAKNPEKKQEDFLDE